MKNNFGGYNFEKSENSKKLSCIQKMNASKILKNVTKYCESCNKSVTRYDRHVKTAYHLKRLTGASRSQEDREKINFEKSENSKKLSCIQKMNMNTILKNATKFCPTCKKSVTRYDRHVKSAFHQKRLNDNFLCKNN